MSELVGGEVGPAAPLPVSLHLQQGSSAGIAAVGHDSQPAGQRRAHLKDTKYEVIRAI